MSMRFGKRDDCIGTVNRGDQCESSLCTLCRADCTGKCETWLSCLEGRKLIYPRDFGFITAGSNNTTHVGVNYNNLRIAGYAFGSHGLAEGLSSDPDDCIFPNVNLETSFGNEVKTKARIPLMTGALGSTFIAERYWESFAAGAALCGMPIVIGENVVGVDRKSEIGEGKDKKGKIKSAPELDRRIEGYLKYADGEYGVVIVQLNVEDTRNGVAEYVVEKYGEKVMIELKWGQGAKDIGGEIQVTSLDYANFLKDRGYVVDPDPRLPEVQAGFKAGSFKSFARHSRLGATDIATVDAVREDFMSAVDYLRKIGFKRISLKTGAYGMRELAMAMKYATDAKLDLLTIDGAGGGTGMSPWNMMHSWGVPSLDLHAMASKFAQKLDADGGCVDLSFAGGFALEDGIFKGLALGAPHVKLICLGRAAMIPGYLGANIEGVLNPSRRKEVNGNWDKLPKNISELGDSAETIFASYHDLQNRIGADAMKDLPYGAIAMVTWADKVGAGVQQIMAGARKFSLDQIARDDIWSANVETEVATGIPHMCKADLDETHSILKG